MSLPFFIRLSAHSARRGWSSCQGASSHEASRALDTRIPSTAVSSAACCWGDGPVPGRRRQGCSPRGRYVSAHTGLLGLLPEAQASASPPPVWRACCCCSGLKGLTGLKGPSQTETVRRRAGCAGMSAMSVQGLVQLSSCCFAHHVCIPSAAPTAGHVAVSKTCSGTPSRPSGAVEPARCAAVAELYIRRRNS